MHLQCRKWAYLRSFTWIHYSVIMYASILNCHVLWLNYLNLILIFLTHTHTIRRRHLVTLEIYQKFSLSLCAALSSVILEYFFFINQELSSFLFWYDSGCFVFVLLNQTHIRKIIPHLDTKISLDSVVFFFDVFLPFGKFVCRRFYIVSISFVFLIFFSLYLSHIFFLKNHSVSFNFFFLLSFFCKFISFENILILKTVSIYAISFWKKLAQIWKKNHQI